MTRARMTWTLCRTLLGSASARELVGDRSEFGHDYQEFLVTRVSYETEVVIEQKIHVSIYTPASHRPLLTRAPID